MMNEKFFLKATVFALFLSACMNLQAQEGSPSAEGTKGDEAAAEAGGEKDAEVKNEAAGGKKEPEVQDPFASKLAPETSIFEGLQEDETPEIQVALQGIGMGASGSYAVLNDDIYLEGEEKKGIKMIEARRGEVDIIVGGTPRTIPLFAGDDVALAREQQKKRSGKVLKPDQEENAELPKEGEHSAL